MQQETPARLHPRHLSSQHFTRQWPPIINRHRHRLSPSPRTQESSHSRPPADRAHYSCVLLPWGSLPNSLKRSARTVAQALGWNEEKKARVSLNCLGEGYRHNLKESSEPWANLAEYMKTCFVKEGSGLDSSILY
jgi:hypothetical protein